MESGTPDTSLDGRVALVTGGAGGLGRAIGAALIARGAAVVPVDVTGDDCFKADIATDEGNRAAVEETVSRHGRLDVLVLNAGVQHMAPLHEFPLEQWDRLMGIMARGPFLAMKHAWPHLTSEPGRRIVVTASASSFVAEPFKAAYVAAKHAVLGLVKVAAREGVASGLTVNAVAPSWVRTPLVDNQIGDRARLYGITEEEALQRVLDDHPVPRLIEPEEVAAVVAFLASPAASAVNGACVQIDLGSLA